MIYFLGTLCSGLILDGVYGIYGVRFTIQLIGRMIAEWSVKIASYSVYSGVQSIECFVQSTG